MRVKITRSIAGPGFALSEGSEADLPDEVARDLVRAGHAVALKAVGDARKPAPEAAVSPAAKRKRRS